MIEEQRKKLELETSKNERKSKKCKWGKPVITKLSEEEIAKGAKSRRLFAYRSCQSCLSCGANPTHIASYDLKGAVKIERYCDTCVTKIS